MAKLFYKLEEAAERLGKTVDEVKAMAASGKLQQFRDRETLMFKRDQVDSLAKTGESASGASGSGIALSGVEDSDAIDLKSDTSLTGADSKGGTGAGKGKSEDSRAATGVSVFDADEVDHADPMAQTQVTQPSTPAREEEELALESVGSGSGLLDLTRESDNTSLGAELLDEIYPGGGSGSGLSGLAATAGDSKTDTAGATVSGGTAAGSSGVFDGAVAIESGPSGLDNLAPTGEEEELAEPMLAPTEAVELSDPAGSWMGSLALLVALVVLFVGFLVAFSSLMGVPSKLTVVLAPQLMVYTIAAAAVGIVLGVIGFFIGKAFAK